jgi:hypothetical protein
MKKTFKAIITGILFLVFSQNSLAEEEGKVGIKSKDDLKAYLEMFRNSHSLLKKGKFRFTESLSYQFDGNSTFFTEESLRVINLYSSLEYGLTKNIGIYGVFLYSNASKNVKTAYTNNKETIIANIKESSNSRFSKIGIKKVIFLEENNFPELVLDFSFSGKNKEKNKTISSKINLIKSFDPIVLLGSFGLNYETDSYKKSVALVGGIGFGINDKIALGSDLSWSIPIGNNFDSKKDNAMLSGRVIITSAQDTFEPSVSFGLTEFSPDMSLGISWSRRF